MLGAQPLAPGWTKARIRPHPGGLSHAKGKVPTPRGPILVDWKQGETFRLSLTLPAGMSAQLDLPAGEDASGVFINGEGAKATRNGKRWIVDVEVSGTIKAEVK